MTAIDQPIPRIKLLVTDLDGTLLGPRPEFNLYNTFRDTIHQLESDPDFRWVVSTGRDLKDYNYVFMPLRSFGITPHFVIVKHAYIFEFKTWGYIPHVIWNLRTLELIWRSRIRVSMGIPKLKRLIGQQIPFVRIPYESNNRISFRFEDSDVATLGATILKKGVIPYHYLQVFQYRNDVDVRIVPFTKGLSMAELSMKLSIPPDHILAIGNGHNDISMMDRRIARFCACPSNAAPEVIEAVHRQGGHIATSPCLGGVIESIQAFHAGKINNELPKDWIPPSGMENPSSFGRNKRLKSRKKRLVSFVLFLFAIYTILLVFASFGIGGPIRGIILRPYYKLIYGVKHLMPENKNDHGALPPPTGHTK